MSYVSLAPDEFYPELLQQSILRLFLDLLLQLVQNLAEMILFENHSLKNDWVEQIYVAAACEQMDAENV